MLTSLPCSVVEHGGLQALSAAETGGGGGERDHRHTDSVSERAERERERERETEREREARERGERTGVEAREGHRRHPLPAKLHH